MPESTDPIQLLDKVASASGIKFDDKKNAKTYLESKGGNYTDALMSMLDDNGRDYDTESLKAAHEKAGLPVLDESYYVKNKLTPDELKQAEDRSNYLFDVLKSGKEKTEGPINRTSLTRPIIETKLDSKKIADYTKENLDLQDKIAKDDYLSKVMPNGAPLDKNPLGERSARQLKGIIADNDKKIKEDKSKADQGYTSPNMLTNVHVSTASKLEKENADLKAQIDREKQEAPEVFTTKYVVNEAMKQAKTKQDADIIADKYMRDQSAKLDRQFSYALDDLKKDPKNEGLLQRAVEVKAHVDAQAKEYAIGFSLEEGIKQKVKAALLAEDATNRSKNKSFEGVNLEGSDFDKVLKNSFLHAVLSVSSEWDNFKAAIKGDTYDDWRKRRTEQRIASGETSIMPAAYRGNLVEQYVDVDGQKFGVDSNGDIQYAADANMKPMIGNQATQKLAEKYDNNRGDYKVNTDVSFKRFIGSNMNVGINMIPMVLGATVSNAALGLVPGMQGTAAAKAINTIVGMGSSYITMHNDILEQSLQYGKGLDYAKRSAALNTLIQSFIEVASGAEMMIGKGLGKGLASALTKAGEGMAPLANEAVFSAWGRFLKKAKEYGGEMFGETMEENAQNITDAVFDHYAGNGDHPFNTSVTDQINLVGSMALGVGGMHLVSSHASEAADNKAWSHAWLSGLFNPSGAKSVIEQGVQDGHITDKEAKARIDILEGSQQRANDIKIDDSTNKERKAELFGMITDLDRLKLEREELGATNPKRKKLSDEITRLDGEINDKWGVYQKEEGDPSNILHVASDGMGGEVNTEEEPKVDKTIPNEATDTNPAPEAQKVEDTVQPSAQETAPTIPKGEETKQQPVDEEAVKEISGYSDQDLARSILSINNADRTTQQEYERLALLEAEWEKRGLKDMQGVAKGVPKEETKPVNEDKTSKGNTPKEASVEAPVQPETKTNKVDIEDKIVVSGTDGGFHTFKGKNSQNEGGGTTADIRRNNSDEKYDIIIDDKNKAKRKESGVVYTYKIKDKKTGKTFLAVGLNDRAKGGLDNERNGSVYVNIEDTGNLPSNIVEILTDRLLKEFNELSQKRPEIFKKQTITAKPEAKTNKATTPKKQAPDNAERGSITRIENKVKKTYEGRVVSKSANGVTIVTDDGKQITGRNYVKTEKKAEPSKVGGSGVDENAWGSDKGLTENFYTTDIDGYAIKKPINNPSSVSIDGVDFHIAKVDGDWKVIEKKSGLEISTGKTSNTKSAAIEDATIRLKQNGGSENLPALIDRAIQGFKDRNTKAVEQSLPTQEQTNNKNDRPVTGKDNGDMGGDVQDKGTPKESPVSVEIQGNKEAARKADSGKSDGVPKATAPVLDSEVLYNGGTFTVTKVNKNGTYDLANGRGGFVKGADIKDKEWGAKFQINTKEFIPIDKTRFGQLLDNLNKAIGNVFGGVFSGAEFEKKVKEQTGETMQDSKGIVYGFVGKDGKVYLNGDYINSNSPIHEYSHVYLRAIKESRPDIYKKGIDLIEKSGYLEQVQNNPAYENLSREDQLEEALAMAIGDRGEFIVSAANKNSFKEWLNDFWNGIKDFFKGKITDLTPEQVSNLKINEFLDLVAGQLVGGGEVLGKGESKIIFNGKSTVVKKVAVDAVNGFYSPLEKTLAETKSDKLPVKQWIDKFGKGEEAKWTGLTDWLNTQTGTVSKSDIQKYLKENRVQIVEVVKGEKIIENDKVKLSQIESKINSMGFALESDMGGGGSMLVDSDGELAEFEGNEEAYSLLEYYNEMSDSNFNDNSRVGEIDTKFSQYQLEGQKENYKEVLVTIPKDALTDTERDRYGELAKKEVFDGLDSFSDAERKEYSRLDKKSKQSREAGFLSSHFDEPNILVHLRMNTRVDAEGKKVLFLEEVQSDWGQKGKKEGFNIPAKKNEFRKEKQSDGSWVVKDANNTAWWHGSTEERADAVINEYSTRETQIPKEVGAIPNAPFVTDTNAWTKLGLKVALKEAVKQGADKIAWTTGEQQNERYDLSKQVDSITSLKKSDGTYEIIAKKEGQDVVNEGGVDIKRIEAIFGKDIAQKISENKGQYLEIKGNNLKTQGKGMKGFYGSPTEGSLGIVGNVAKSLFKQEPKITEIKSGDGSVTESDARKGIPLTKAEAKEFYYDNTGTKNGLLYAIKENGQVERLDTLADINNTSPYDNLVKVIPKENSTQHSIDITPELKASVGEGLPLFQIIHNDNATKQRIEDAKVRLKNAWDAMKTVGITPKDPWKQQREVGEVISALIEIAIANGIRAKDQLESIIKSFGKIPNQDRILKDALDVLNNYDKAEYAKNITRDLAERGYTKEEAIPYLERLLVDATKDRKAVIVKHLEDLKKTQKEDDFIKEPITDTTQQGILDHLKEKMDAFDVNPTKYGFNQQSGWAGVRTDARLGYDLDVMTAQVSAFMGQAHEAYLAAGGSTIDFIDHIASVLDDMGNKKETAAGHLLARGAYWLIDQLKASKNKYTTDGVFKRYHDKIKTLFSGDIGARMSLAFRSRQSGDSVDNVEGIEAMFQENNKIVSDYVNELDNVEVDDDGLVKMANGEMVDNSIPSSNVGRKAVALSNDTVRNAKKTAPNPDVIRQSKRNILEKIKAC